MTVPRVFKSRQRKRKNISIVLSSHKRGKRLYDACRVLFFCYLPARVSAKKRTVIAPTGWTALWIGGLILFHYI